MMLCLLVNNKRFGLQGSNFKLPYLSVSVGKISSSSLSKNTSLFDAKASFLASNNSALNVVVGFDTKKSKIVLGFVLDSTKSKNGSAVGFSKLLTVVITLLIFSSTESSVDVVCSVGFGLKSKIFESFGLGLKLVGFNPVVLCGVTVTLGICLLLHEIHRDLCCLK